MSTPKSASAPVTQQEIDQVLREFRQRKQSAPELPRPLSDRKLAANRANARKSTGPRTPQGKRASSRNATTHGIFCNELCLPGENETVFREFRTAILAD